MGARPRIRVLIVDDQSVVRIGLAALLLDGDGIEVVGEAANGRQAVALAAALEPDVVLMDLMMPEMNGAEATRAIHAKLPRVQVLLMTSLESSALVLDAVRAGAAGYVSKSSDQDRDEILEAVYALAHRQTFLPEEITRRLLEAEEELRWDPKTPPTPREIEIAAWVARGLSNEQVAERAFVSRGTVRTHLRHLYDKLGVSSRVELALYAVRAGWAPLDG